MCTQVREGEIQMPVQMVKSAPDGPLCSWVVRSGPDWSNITQLSQELFGSSKVTKESLQLPNLCDLDTNIGDVLVCKIWNTLAGYSA